MRVDSGCDASEPSSFLTNLTAGKAIAAEFDQVAYDRLKGLRTQVQTVSGGQGSLLPRSLPQIRS